MALRDNDRMEKELHPETGIQHGLHIKVADWALLGSGICLMSVGIIFLALEKGGAIPATAGLACMLAATMDRFKSFKWGGIEVLTRELEEKIEQADVVLEKLRNVAEISGSALISLHAQAGRHVGQPTATSPTVHQGFALADRVRESLTALGSEPSTIRDVLMPWAQMTGSDICFALSRSLDRAVAERMFEENEARQRTEGVERGRLDERWVQGDRFRSRLDSTRTVRLAAMPEAFMDLFEQTPLLEAQQVQAFLEEASRWIPVLVALRDRQSIDDAAVWIPEIQSLRDAGQHG